MFRLDTFRLIKKTFNRFLSLLCIVLIGTAFMMGLMSNPTIMRKSVDVYNDTYHLQDIQLYSSYGFCQEDVVALNKTEGIDRVEASKQVDVYCQRKDGTVLVARILETNPKVNGYCIESGNEPKKENECLVLVNMNSQQNYLIDDTITLFLEDDEIGDYLKNDEFQIVGTCKSPAYLSKTLGTSNLDNQDLNLIIYVPKSNFVFEYYTTIFLTLKGSEEYVSYTKEYQNYIEEKKDCVSELASTQQNVLKEKIYEEYAEKLIEGKQTLQEEKEKGQKQLDDAKKELNEAYIQIVATELDISTYETLLQKAKDKIDTTSNDISSRQSDLENDKKEIEKKYGKSYEDAFASISADYVVYNTNLATISSYNSSIDSINKQIEQLNNEKQTLDPIEDSARIHEIDALVLNYQNQLKSIKNNESNIQLLKDSNEAMDKKYQDLGYENITDAYQKMLEISSEKALLDSAKEGLDETNTYVQQINQKLVDMKKQVEEGRQEYEEGLLEYEDGVKEFEEKIEEAEAQIKKSEQDLNDLPNAKWMILDRESHYSSYMYASSCSQMEAIGFSLPILFYLVAALVSMTTMTRLIDEQRGQIGIYVALGYRPKQIIGKYISYALMACFLGSLIGILIGNILFPTVIYNTWKLMYNSADVIISYPFVIVCLCTLAFSMLMVLVTGSVVKNSLKECAASLMRPKAPKNAKEVFLEKIGFVWKRLSFTGKITARNLIRYKSRFFMTVIGVAGCTGLLVVGFGIKDSISDVINIQFGRIFGYDYQIYLENDYHIDENVEILLKDENNEVVVPFMTYTSKVYFENDEDTISVEIMNVRSFNEVMGLEKTDRKSELKLNSSGVIVSQKFAINNNIEKGDTITIESNSGVKADVKVEEICEMYFQHYLFMSDSYYEEVFGEKVHNTNIVIKTNNLDSLKEDIDSLQDYNSIVDFSSMIEQFQVMIEALDLIILVIILTAGSLALVVLINLTQVNISERIREIATLKVLGFRDNEVNSYIFKEILLLTLIGGLLGLPLGVLEHHFIMNIINMEMVMFGMKISLASFTYSFAITVVFTVLVLFFTRKPLRQIDMIESLKSVE